MKTNFLWILVLVSALALTGCHKDEPTPETPTPDVPAVERPTWKAVATDYYGYMTIILDAASLPAEIDTNDLVSAFMGTVCRGVKGPYAEQDGITRIYLSVKPSEAEATSSDAQVVLQYYSAKEKRIYTSEPLPYADEEMLGTMAEGYKPVWK